ncbi:MAG: hypothetical protein ACRDKB_04045 [Actinomycetota bacterium]
MLLAHAGSAGGIHFETLIIGVALIVLAVILYFNKNVKTSGSVALLVLGLAMGTATFVFAPGPTEALGVSMAIMSPDDGENVPAGEPIDVEVSLQGATTEPASATGDEVVGHIHVFVDGQLLQMPTGTATELELEPGDHTLTVEFVGVDHQSFEPRVMERVEVTAS